MFPDQSFRYRSLILVLVIALLLSACAPVIASNSNPDPDNRVITVVGQGEAFGVPDQVQVQVGVEVFAESVKQASQQNEDIVLAIMEALEAQGIDRKDIQTTNYSVWTEQIYGDRGPEGIAGYRVSNQVNVTLRDIAKVSDVLAAVIEAGANNIFGVTFSVADPSPLIAEAREEAMADARARAEALSGLAGVELGQVKVISEVISQPGLIIERAMAAEGIGGGGPSISPGQLSFQVQVQVTYEIK